MSDTLIPGAESPTGDFVDFVGYDELDLDALNGILEGLQQNRVSFDDIPYGTPHQDNYDGSWKTLVSRRILSADHLTSDTPLSLFRKKIKGEVVASGFPAAVGDDATVVASEFVGNNRLHGGGSSEHQRYTGECRLRLCQQQLGGNALRVTTVIEAANYSAHTSSSAQEQARGEHEGGHGFEVIQAMAEEHGGTLGRYRIERDTLGTERIITDPAINRGSWVIWASFPRELDS